MKPAVGVHFLKRMCEKLEPGFFLIAAVNYHIFARKSWQKGPVGWLAN
jgi:hypothetical protein